MRKSDSRRAVLRTVLLVGEGYAEVAFIEHLKALYVHRGCGIVLTVKNARGKGALHVVEVAIRQSRNADFDVKAALLDTDTGWDDKTRTLARKGKVLVVPCIPCLEAMLLAFHGEVQQAQTPTYFKQAFENRFGKPANNIALYAKYFSKETFDKARVKSTTRTPASGRRAGWSAAASIFEGIINTLLC